ncbi:MAG: FAD:protein FMN transferase [Paludibacteraceae bacterium]|nr:FAD:protein FMN transferase [Paludibacteraceae bacterium]MBQ9296739.1 FAD:protein FMN transferase [Paludibacteraceae bacterium]
MNRRKARIISALLGLIIAATMLFVFTDEEPSRQYYLNQGRVFGTYYTIRYEAETDLEDSIQTAFRAFDNSLSMFNPHSTLSAINDNRDTVTDRYFETMWTEAKRVYELSDGAFDITVAPLVNYWGFGRKGKPKHDPSTGGKEIDSLMQFVGFDKVELSNHHVIKSDPRIQLDGGAVAKGQACDMISTLLAENGCNNYLVEIGGEIVCRGVNSKGEKWHIGITKPTEEQPVSPSAKGRESSSLQEIITVHNLCMATSGNYRNFYYEGKQKRSHTIDPRTGRPVQHSLLSATVVSSSCMRADALATACMVQGSETAMQMIERAGDAACYFIIAENDSTKVITSPNWDKMLQK